LNGGTLEVTSDNSGGDTENLQCAIDFAIESGFRDIYLSSSAYDIGAVSAKGFRGDLRGRSKGATLVSIQNGALNCSERMGAAMEFQVGNASVRNMTISVDSPCADGNAASVIAFFSNAANCADRTVFGNVDRVVIAGAGTQGSDTVVGITADVAPGCDSAAQRVLGTLKVNRSELRDLEFGVRTYMGGGGQVDINYNSVVRVGLPISILDANQTTTILANKITFNDIDSYAASSGIGTTAIYVASTAASPNTNTTTIKNNTLTDGGLSASGVAVFAGQIDKGIDHKMAVTGNTFQGISANTDGRGLIAIDTEDGVISGNTFLSAAGTWIDISSGDSTFVGRDVSGWAIVANEFSGSTANTDISLGEGTSGVIVGRSQGFPVVDDVTGANDILESSMSGNTAFAKRPRSVRPAAAPTELFHKQLLTLMRLDPLHD
tara:strand:- start:780 stop:2084 length:1305 start_codon:yes stop_codon:yes gene_type:complete